MERPLLYLCDPEKHTECRKTNCVHNPMALNQVCQSTTNPAFAKLDEQGKPIQMPDFLEQLRAEEERNAEL